MASNQLKSEDSASAPSPVLFFDTMNAFQRSAALRGAIELELFTQIGDSKRTAVEIAALCHASEKGIRVLCDYLTIIGFLEKSGNKYALTRDSSVFLRKDSPAYIGRAVEFLHAEMLQTAFADVAGCVRKGGTLLPEGGSTAAEHPEWVKFAQGMAPLMRPAAIEIAKMLEMDSSAPFKVLDVAAGHGIFGISILERYKNAEVVALDWPDVLKVATENAKQFGVGARHSTIPGDAFRADFKEQYDLVLLTNFLHHFDKQTCVELLSKVHSALKPNGKALTLEFVPNEDRISPPGSAAFSMIMLCSTASGDAYTFSELREMFQRAGFSDSQLHSLGNAMQQVVISAC